MAFRYDNSTDKVVKIDQQTEVFESSINPELQTSLFPSQLVSLREDAEEELDDTTLLKADDPKVQNTLNQLVDFRQRKLALADQAEQITASDPATFPDIKSKILEPGQQKEIPILEQVTRVLNFDIALEAGATRGFIRHLRNQETPLDSIMDTLKFSNPELRTPTLTEDVLKGVEEGVRENLTFGDILRKDLDLPAGPSFRIKLPKFAFNAITPTHALFGIAKDVLEGRSPVEIRPFGPVLTTRGAVGLAMDILLFPIAAPDLFTY